MSFRSGLIQVGRVTRRPHIPRSTSNVSRLHIPIILHSKSIASVSYHDRQIFSRVEYSLHEFIASANAKNLAEIHQRYPALVHDLNSAQGVTSSSSLLTAKHLNDVFDALSASARLQDIELMNKILSEMHTLFGVEPTIETHTIIVHSFIRSGHHSTAYNWIRNIPRKPPHTKPSMQLWHSYLETWLQKDDTHAALSGLLKEIRRTGYRPLSTTYELLIQACRKGAPLVLPLDYFDVLMKDMQKYWAPYSPSVATQLRQFYAENGQAEDGAEVARQYESHSRQESPEEHWCQILSDKAYDIGTRGALRFFVSELQPAGCQASPQIFKALLRHSKSLGDLWHLEKSLGITAGPTHWAIVIRNAALAGNIPAALEIYEESKRAGIHPNSALVDPLIRGLCTHRISPPTDSDIDTALRIYQALVTAEATIKETSPDKSTLPPGPDIKTYQNLIRALSSSTKILKWSPTVKSLIQDMQSRQIFSTDSETTTSIIILLMRLSTNFDQAFASYRRFHASLDEKGYTAVLAAFCKLSFEGEFHLPSLSQYFEIVDDMRQAGHPLSVRIYTVFLGQLARIIEDHPEFQMELIRSTRQTHDMLTLDASVSPDAHVWNQLMDTYQRLGCFADAYRVWDLMYLSGRFDHASVSIILDACGYAMAWSIAKSITGKLFAEGFKFNLRNWNTWLECLCRLGRLEDAVKTACLSMPKEGVEPNVDSIRTLMFCAQARGQRSAVGARIRLFLPTLWKKLPKDLQ